MKSAICLLGLAVVLCAGLRARADIISHLPLDGTLEDEVGGNDGIWGGALEPIFVEDRDGNFESAVLFGGADEYIQLLHNSGLPLYSHPAFSVAMWVRGGIQNDRRIWSESSTLSGTPLYTLGTQNFGTTGQFDLYVRSAAGAVPAQHLLSASEPFDDTWHHVAWVDDGGTCTLYVDGRPDPAGISYVRPAMDFDITTIGAVVRTSPAVCCVFTGAIDDVQIFDHALTEEEVLELSGKVAPCPKEGDTHCDDLLVEPPPGAPGLYLFTALDAVDTSGDAILYTFTRDDGQGFVETVGPQVNNFVEFDLGEGEWTITVMVDDDPLCDDTAIDATCPIEVSIACPGKGDTHCTSFDVRGPSGNAPGTYRLTATGLDDSGDVIFYTFRAVRGDERPLLAGPQVAADAAFNLGIGTWTLSVSADDGDLCGDVAPDAPCKAVEVDVTAAAPSLLAHFTLDGHLDDETGEHEAVPVSGIEPAYVDGADGTDPGAARFDPLLGDLLAIDQPAGMGVYANEAYSVAMWVRGLPQPDFRVFSEGWTLNNTPLFNIGTQNQGATGQVDLFVRAPGTNPLAHRWSAREAFDGEWHHIAWIDDNGDAVLYIDGVRDATDFRYRKPAMTLDTTTVGGILRAAPSHYFTGDIDDVRLYNYALSLEEVETLVPEPDDCPEAGDTHCDFLSVTPTKENRVGDWTFTALDADDESGDPILYTFVAENAEGDYLQSGPGPEDTATFFLTGGTWTVRVTADDSIRCRDLAPTATCEVTVDVTPDPELLLSHWKLDGNFDDSQPAANHGMGGAGAPGFADGPRPDLGQAAEFDGVDDLVVVAQNDGLPLYSNRVFTIAMWVKGDGTSDNIDDRVWSEGNTLNNAPLFNLGTHFQGATGQVDFFIRSAENVTVVNHRLSTGTAFDGTWHHIAWVDDNGDAALYIDGERDPTDFSYTRPVMELDTTTIGGILRGGPCCLFTGSIDDVRVYNYALDEDEIMALVTGEKKPEGLVFNRGDADGNGRLELTDPVFVLNFLFLGGPTPSCMAAADARGEGMVTLTSAVYILNFLFLGGPAPPPPFGECGRSTLERDLTLGCESFRPCEG